jgi:glycosyltransferase involved in cell wall biosynthesis
MNVVAEALPPVLMLCGDYPPALSGVGDYSARLTGALARRGTRLTVLTGVGEGREGESCESGVRVLRAMPGWRMRDARRVLAALDALGPGAILHVQYPGVAFRRDPMINLLPALVRARRPGTPVVVTVHDARVMRARWRARVAPMLAAARAVVHVDEPDGPVLRRWTLGARPELTCIPIGSSIETLPATPAQRAVWRGEMGLEEHVPTVVFFGILFPHKGLAELVAAMERIRARRPVRLLVVGDFDRATPFQAEVEALLRPGQTAGWIVWLRRAGPAAVSRALHAADAAALPFHSGAAANRSSLLAALAHGLPTVTTRGPATTEAFAARFPVSLVPPRDPAALADALTAVLDGLPATAAFRARCAAAVPAWDAVAARTLGLYARLSGAEAT